MGSRAAIFARRAALMVAAWSASACGDALLPSDFAGPPASEVGGNVLVTDTAAYREAERPRLSLEWLTDMDPDGRGHEAGSALLGQVVSFERSSQLLKDWDIGLSVPTESARLPVEVKGLGDLGLAIGKMVYFDDLDGDGRLAWSCGSRHDDDGARCDGVMAVSNEFVVYVEEPLFCGRSGGDLKTDVGRPSGPRLRAGYHYYVVDNNQAVEIEAGDGLNFLVDRKSPRDSDPTTSLRAFTNLLVRSLSLDVLQGC